MTIDATTRRAWAVPALAGVVSGLAMAVCLGWSVVDPTQFEWLMHADYALHFFGWHLYRHGPWTWPLGATPLLLAPIGSSIGLTDSIPLVAIPLKVLNGILPPVFQFIGLWLVASVALQGVFGVLLMRLVTPRVPLQLLGAALLVLSPPLIYRINHAALTAHWLLLAALWLTFKNDRTAVSHRRAVAWAALCAATAATQPYLLLMVAVLMAAAYGRQLLMTPTRIGRIALHVSAGVTASLLALWQSGSLMVRGSDGLEIGGFGAWSSNLFTFVMPTEAWTLFYPGPIRYAHHEQYEGYAYLGAGMLLLAVVVLAARVLTLRQATWSRSWWHHVPFVLALLFLATMAVGPRITAGQQVLFTYDPSWWGPLTIFRTSGRMIWPVYYAIVVGILFAAARFPYRRALVALALALVIQMVDLAGMYRHVSDLRAFGFRDPLQSRFWNAVLPHYDGLALIPPNLCTPEGYLDFVPFALRAGTSRIAINTGMTARFDVRRARVYCDQLRHEMREGLRPHRSLYIVRLDLLPALMARSEASATCTVIDGFGVCFSPDSFARWRDVFDVPRSRLPDAAEFLRFHSALDETYRTVLGRRGRDEAGATEVRLESLIQYLALRLDGCAHADAAERALRWIDGTPPPSLCAPTALQHTFPPADETYAFNARLIDALRQRGDGRVSRTHVDAEGEAVWVQAYAKERAAGRSEANARETVLSTIRRAAQ